MTQAHRRAQIVGAGLIGGSVAKGLRKRGWFVTGRDLTNAHAERALELGVVDAVGVDSLAELVVVAVPPSALVGEVRRSLEECQGIVTDTGSVKTNVVAEIDHPRFVAGHPMAGSEQDGLNGADATLFDNAVWVLTPRPETDDGALHRLQAIIASLGADVVTMTAERHDRLVAVVSHVPHL
ncbi:MAG: prephenate dehydrogenase/arogenate dehydrogenase family protein, partial [Actinomycetota bacterium]|nr:prephenate dehydrogenase/arogenate dehydrogenase family protein [Actinomycetota bacterium]